VPDPAVQTAEENDGSSGLVAGGSSARNVRLWPRGGQPVIDHLEGVL
jgi:hypothetical protein